MPNLKRAIANVGGAIAEYGDMEIKAQIEERHARRMAAIKGQYASEARADNQKFQLERDTQAQKERFRVAEYGIGAKETAATTAHERKAGESAKDRASREKIASIGAAGRGAADVSRRMGDAKILLREMLKADPDGDKQEMFFKAYSLANESKTMSPEEDVRSMYRSTYNMAVKADIPEDEARQLAKDAQDNYQKDMYPELVSSRERFKKQTRDGKALADTAGRDPKNQRNGKALADGQRGNKKNLENGKAMGVMEAPEAKIERLRSLY